MPSILIVDDEQGQRAVLRRILKREGYEVETANNRSDALEKMGKRMFDVVVSDMRMTSQMEGRDLLREIKQQDPDLPVLIMTAFAEINDAVDLVAREGAFYYLEKPIDIDVLKKELKRAVDSRGASPVSNGDSDKQVPDIEFETVVGQSPPMKQLFRIMCRIIYRGVNQVLITGKTGTGKEVVAKAIHEYGRRQDKPFVPINCSAIPEQLIESELFGHEKGAFTGADHQKMGQFELADGGTVFLDEIGDIPVNMQSKLLRVLQEREVSRVGGTKPIKVDVCVIAATNSDLKAACDAGEFREDLYFRLNVIPLHVPLLKDRTDDIPILVDHFLTKFSKEYLDAEQKSVAPRAMSALRRYDWPGNVRQLENSLHRIFVLSENDEIDLEDLRPDISEGAPPLGDFQVEIPEQGVLLEDIMKEYICVALAKTHGNQTKAAELLGISRRRLQNRIQNYGIDSQEFKNG
jgi:DNA-binding NtrC family response regulator